MNSAASQLSSRSASLIDRKRVLGSRGQKVRPASVAYPVTQPGEVDREIPAARYTATSLAEPVVRVDSRLDNNRGSMQARTVVLQANASTPTPQKLHSQRLDGHLGSKAQQLRSTDQTPLKATSATWIPSATLLAHSNTAPLANRISIPPLAAHAPITLQGRSMGALSLTEQEKVLIDDLLFILMGFEGQYICYEEKYKPLEEKHRLTGPRYRFTRGVDNSLRDLADSALTVASSYSALETFLDVMGKDENGAIAHALCAAIRRILKDYLILVTQLESQHVDGHSFTLHHLILHLKPTGHVLAQLRRLTQDVLQENGVLGDTPADVDMSEDLEDVLDNLRQGRDTALPRHRSCKGGAILRLITRRLRATAGDPVASELLNSLLAESSRPYMRMLNEWLHYGNVVDLHNEFLIKEQKSIRREGLQQDYTDEYWEKRYTVRLEHVPPQLEALMDKILLAGKYLNVVRECGGVASQVHGDSPERDFPQILGDPRVAEEISKAYTFANQSLLSLLISTHGLPARFRSLKHYFFLDHGDFFSHFLELSSSELRKPSKNVNANKLQSLLDIVIRQPGSVAAEDPFKEDVKVTMSDTGLTGWLMRIVNVQGMDADASSLSAAYTPANRIHATKDEKDINGYEALTLDYTVPFPLSLIISRNTLTRYQLLFRYLLSLRHLEIQLTTSWTEHTKGRVWKHRAKTPAARTGNTPNIERIENWKRRAWTLRSRMLCFVQQLLYFCTSEVIEPNWTAFMHRLQECADWDDSMSSLPGSAQGPTTADATLKSSKRELPRSRRTVDELMQDHVDLLATCLKECMLTNSKLLRINSKVMSTCALFANYTSSLTRSLLSADEELTNGDLNDGSKLAYDPGKLDKLFNILQQYEDHFSRHLKILLDALNYLAATETVVFLGLCARLSMANEHSSRDAGLLDVTSNASAYG